MMDYSREKKLAEDVADGINSMCFNNKAFCETMARQHRTLQADFTQLCFEWFETCRNNYEKDNYDGRNELECKTAKMMLESLK